MKQSNKRDYRQGQKKKFEKHDEKKSSGSSTSYNPGKNDWRWYAPTERIAQDIASIPFNHMSGTPWHIGGFDNTGSTWAYEYRSGAICVYDYALSTGGGKPSRADGINMAAKQLYTEVRRNNSGAKNYEAPDLMMYILAMREVYALYFTIKRALGILNTFTFENRAFPQAIYTSLGLTDYNSDIANISVLRGRLNLLASQINSFAVPKYFKVFMRDAWMASNIFADSNSLMGQFYAYKLRYTRSWSGINGSHLITDSCENTLEGLMDQLEAALQALFDDTDVNTMAGDIVKAFGADDLYKVAEIEPDYAIIPVYDEDMLNQIQNSICYKLEENGIQDPESLNITQDIDNQTIVFSPTIATTGWPDILQSYVFNSHKDSPNYTDVLEWSRLITVPYLVTVESDIAMIGVVTGAELLVGGKIYFVNGVNDVKVYDVPNSVGALSQGDLMVYQTFDWHPILYTAHTNNGVGYYICGDVKKATIVDAKTISRIHDAAMYSLFYLSK